MIEKGRKHKIDSDKRFCNKCEKNEVEDQFHAIMNCDKHSVYRQKLFDYLTNNFQNWCTFCDAEKFVTILNADKHYTQIAEFITKVIY